MSKIVFKAEEQIKNIVNSAVKTAYSNGELCADEIPDFIVEIPADKSHGDFAVNTAMVCARAFKMAPRQIAELIERNTLVRNIDDRAFVPKLEKLATNHLVAIKVKCTEGGFADCLCATRLPDAIGNVIVGAGIVIDPMVVDRNKAPENAFVNDMKERKATTHMVLTVFQEHLSLLGKGYFSHGE